MVDEERGPDASIRIAQALQVEIGSAGGIHGLWVLVPANDQTPLPTLNQKAIRITNAAPHACLTEIWITNRQRATTAN